MSHSQLRDPHLALFVERLEFALDDWDENPVVAAFRRWRRAAEERASAVRHKSVNN